jgi:CheY-like chemotaxis protein
MSTRVLVVDDEASIQRLLQVCLEYLGCTVDIAVNGKDALAKLARAAYHGVILDLTMPGGMDGLAVLRSIRRSHPMLPVVMMSGQPADEVVPAAMAAGAQSCLLKPFDISQLERTVKAWIASARNAA